MIVGSTAAWRQRGSLAAGVLLSLVVAGCDREPAKTTGEPAPIADVTVAVTKAQSVPVTFEFVGQTEASAMIDIRARVQGVVIEKAFKDGAEVKEGDLLYRIDPRSFQADLDVAKARLSRAEATVRQAGFDLARAQQLSATNALARKDLDDAQAALDTSQADVRLSRANVAKAELDLSYTTITAPIKGVMSKGDKHMGDLVDAGQNSLLARVYDLDPIFVNFSVSERQILEARKQSEEGKLRQVDKDLIVEITTIDGALYEEKGRINFGDVVVNPQTGTNLSRAEFPNAKGRLGGGLFVTVRLVGVERPNAIVAPQRAVQIGPTGAYVYVVGENDTVEMRPVTATAWQDSYWVIENGLKPGERVITEGLQKTQPGAKVRVRDTLPPIDLSATSTATRAASTTGPVTR